MWFAELTQEGRKLAEGGEFDELLGLIEDASRIDDLAPDERILITVNLAWSLAHAGQPERAIEVVVPLISQLSVDDAMIAYAWGALGCAHALANHHGKAIEVLTDSLAARLEDAWVVSGQFFHRGESLHALGRVEEALHAWSRSYEIHATGLFGQRAQARLRDRREGEGPYR